MSQYATNPTTGLPTVSISTATPYTVTGDGTAFLANVTGTNPRIKVGSDALTYPVAAVVSDTELTLGEAYPATVTDQAFVIWQDFTPLLSLPYMRHGDLGAPEAISRAFDLLDVAVGTAASVASGTYTPSATLVMNADAATPGVAQYMRMGDVVTVSGKVNVVPTSGGQTQIGLSLPIASAFAADGQAAGSALSTGTYSPIIRAAIYADVTNDRAMLDSDGATTCDLFYQYTYLVV